jgi:hypothetical protein
MTKRIPGKMAVSPRKTTAQPEPDFDWSWAEDSPTWVSPAVDTKTPSIARIYNYALGGKDHYIVDREVADHLFDAVPGSAHLAQANRAFVIRAVEVMAQAGIRQFLDLGCGIPTGPAIHEVARSITQGVRVAYIDHDPIVLAHMRAALDGQTGLHAALHDLREPPRVLYDRGVRQVIRLEEPIGLVMGAVLHFVDLAIGAQVMSHYLNKIAPGSYVALSTGTQDKVAPEAAQNAEQILRTISAPIFFRTAAQVEELVDGLELLPPGITDVTRWRTDSVPGTLRLHAGVAVKR